MYDQFSFWPFIAAFFSFFLCWGITQTLFASLIVRAGAEGTVGKVLAVVIALVGGLYGEHVLAGLFNGVSGQALFVFAAVQTHRDVATVLGGLPGMFSVLGNLVSGG